MPKPRSRNELVHLAAKRFEELCALCDSMSEHEHAVSFDFSGGGNRKEAHWQRDKNVRDVLTHLYEWHQLLLTWVRDNRNGQSRPFLPAPHNWRTYGKLNEQFWRQHQSTALGGGKTTRTFLPRTGDGLDQLLQRSRFVREGPVRLDGNDDPGLLLRIRDI